MKHFNRDKNKGEFLLMKIIIEWIIYNILSKIFKSKNDLKIAELTPIQRSIWLSINNHERDRTSHLR